MLHQKDVDEKIKLMVVSESSKDLDLMEEMVRLQISTRKVPSMDHCRTSTMASPFLTSLSDRMLYFCAGGI